MTILNLAALAICRSGAVVVVEHELVLVVFVSLSFLPCLGVARWETEPNSLILMSSVLKHSLAPLLIISNEFGCEMRNPTR